MTVNPRQRHSSKHGSGTVDGSGRNRRIRSLSSFFEMNTTMAYPTLWSPDAVYLNIGALLVAFLATIVVPFTLSSLYRALLTKRYHFRQIKFIGILSIPVLLIALSTCLTISALVLGTSAASASPSLQQPFMIRLRLALLILSFFNILLANCALLVGLLVALFVVQSARELRLTLGALVTIASIFLIYAALFFGLGASQQ